MNPAITPESMLGRVCYDPRMPSPRLERAPDLVERRVADETFLLPVKGALANTVEMFALSEVGQFIWSLSDGSRSVEDLVSAVVAEFDIDEGQARQDVTDFVERLKGFGLMLERERES